MIFAVDFDGTICEHKYPEIGKPIEDVVEALKQLKADGHTLILWTCRDGKQLDEALEACKSWGLEFDKINSDSDEHLDKYESRPRKIGADYYIDDRAMSPAAFVIMSKFISKMKDFNK